MTRLGNPDQIVQTEADGVQVGDVVRFCHRGQQSGIPWRVTHVSEQKIQHHFGFWYRELTVVSLSSKRWRWLGTYECVVLK